MKRNLNPDGLPMPLVNYSLVSSSDKTDLDLVKNGLVLNNNKKDCEELR